MNGYKAFYNDKECEVYANTSYEAYKAAIGVFKPPKSKSHMVHVYLCEKQGEQVIHTPTE